MRLVGHVLSTVGSVLRHGARRRVYPEADEGGNGEIGFKETAKPHMIRKLFLHSSFYFHRVVRNYPDN